MRSTYLMVLPVPAARTGPGKFAIESAFAQHLRMLKAQLGDLAEELVIAVPELPSDSPAVSSFEEVDEVVEGIRFEALYGANVGRAGYFLNMPRALACLFREVRTAGVVHSGNSDLYRPLEFTSLLMGWLMGKKTISVTDIDQRNTARMNYQSGKWSRKEYLMTRLAHDNWQHLQQLIGARLFDLVLLKGRALTADYGRGRANVRYFLDSAYSAEHIIKPEQLEAKKKHLADPNAPLLFTYFGRLVGYKGLPDMIEAITLAVSRGARVRLRIIGNGPDLAELTALVERLNAGDFVEFVGSVPFGSALFKYLYSCDVLLAAPQSEDTPRSALDALAAGMPLLAYDTYYYRELSESGAPVTLVPWLNKQELANKILAMDVERAELSRSCEAAVSFARQNTQETWIEKRIEWTRAMAGRAS